MHVSKPTMTIEPRGLLIQGGPATYLPCPDLCGAPQLTQHLDWAHMGLRPAVTFCAKCAGMTPDKCHHGDHPSSL